MRTHKYPSDVTDEQWRLIERLIPGEKRGREPFRAEKGSRPLFPCEARGRRWGRARLLRGDARERQCAGRTACRGDRRRAQADRFRQP